MLKELLALETDRMVEQFVVSREDATHMAKAKIFDDLVEAAGKNDELMDLLDGALF